MSAERDEEVQRMVTEWKKEHEGKLIDPHPDDGEHNNQRFCCLVYGKAEIRVSDCEKRRGNNRTHYTPIYLGRETYRVPKPKFALCIGCNVWKQLPPQEEDQVRHIRELPDARNRRDAVADFHRANVLVAGVLKATNTRTREHD